MGEAFAEHVIPGVLRLTLFMSLGILLGYVMEVFGIIRRLARLARPVISWANLPPVCAASFVTALASQKAAGAMLSAAYTNSEITRGTLVLGAVANTFPSALMHLRVAAPVLVATLGFAGGAYVVFTVANAAVVLGIVLVAGHFRHAAASGPLKSSAEPVPREKSLPQYGWQGAWQRWKRLLPRVLLLAVPVYTLAAVLTETGVFKAAARGLPRQLAEVLPPEAITVIVVQMGSTVQAAPVAKSFLDAGTLGPLTLFFVLVTGYVVSLPGRVLRRSLPATLSVFPGRNGFYVIALSQGARWLVALTVVLLWWYYRIGVM